MRIASYSLIRNEEPILPAFLDQLTALFDVAVIVDHSSTDRSRELVRGRRSDKLVLYHLDAVGYPQSELATLFARHIHDAHDPDYLFFLDADEFLPFADRDHLERTLSQLPPTQVLQMSWANICPVHLDGRDIFSEPFLVDRAKPGIPKVAITRDAGRDVLVHQGNHAVTIPGSEPSIAMMPVPLFHIPVQSRVQFTFKVVSGSNRLMLDRVKLDAGLGIHWVDLAREIARQPVSDERLRTIALGYGLAEDDQSQVEQFDLQLGWLTSEYAETGSYVEAQTRALLSGPVVDRSSTVVRDDSGSVLFEL